ncbi:MAG: bifunctional diaminohydroxyphosphoribosylaminopyrimidine deaminase/5-amino-6-(5-phosphoribosylamino)uracil reductase RibD [Saprospiraceae bacterium]|jgi:diaminohydroxyphosphoribosylaminopyrimidine deaminase/5-amino-6-(5-phosphoribosylamino)uracil reductase|uniref:bifunctional diaminohydroxyphosphoribosylaminopyrimidine deaminase/5-amino-6-(5-phosphoribosylamino)uracil reductase RibD n=1 Tax=Candidatus Brachybacter algidus TaxID=2982024 RepID=UPI001B3E880B|nr:bifunctional diaminohydroxyphosphoribosylaminopyrimidine deaminase/5-amino-6-(5-phosphoribosylamino)uracil reductase RibD [Candidatus Brachybacter algidus]MBP7305050.1 bifunctional diaminohydroxyphosphoribosylaminopyrimidine deaminase/5-amino-6-(5-phosphoribosylamino)uracil reductase RibD [Saprospiraceae bacterium]MBK6373137.1 bifunctional diaminohydroxyphosphoribosylaminopyrimidine deaminase/5-amino-6-(5-phosphoribosylamino)uracil reductase RibD [Candidatus Brachybacter algidus]MBK6447786.1 
MKNNKDIFLLRSIDLANLADRDVKSNPPVGCVIVENDIIIGEGRHEKFGEAHAEVNAFKNATENGHNPGNNSEVYVTLEPCGHYGKTPPCAELISSFKPKAVHIFEKDSHPITADKGLELLKHNDIYFEFNEIKGQKSLLDRFYKNNLKKQPYIILKYAQTADQFMASSEGQIQISDQYTSRLSHKWRSLCDGILIGRNTLETDDPELTNRHWSGSSPQRFVVGNSFTKPLSSYKMFQGDNPAILITTNKSTFEGIKTVVVETIDWNQIWSILYDQYSIYKLMVEGGSKLLQSVIDAGAWDEARVITSKNNVENGDISAPILSAQESYDNLQLINDSVQFFKKVI